ncbi:MAG: peptide-binding protein [Deltaproteobacteria bacterium]|nr:MAG: peptide-binding protein [Deltaproteobacteria bacterium]
MLRKFSLTILWMAILLGPASAYMASIGKENVNVRNAPSINAKVLFQIPFGYPVEVIQSKDSWVEIKDYEDDTGWVYQPLIKRNVQTVLVTPDLVNIRQGPGLNYKVVDQIEGGKIYKLFEEKGQWVKIGFYLENKEIGWVRSDLVWGE